MEPVAKYSEYQRIIVERYLNGFEEMIEKLNSRSEAVDIRDNIFDKLGKECESNLIKSYLLKITDDIIEKHFKEQYDN